MNERESTAEILDKYSRRLTKFFVISRHFQWADKQLLLWEENVNCFKLLPIFYLHLPRCFCYYNKADRPRQNAARFFRNRQCAKLWPILYGDVSVMIHNCADKILVLQVDGYTHLRKCLGWFVHSFRTFAQMQPDMA